jgi:replicative DNA helicase
MKGLIRGEQLFDGWKRDLLSGVQLTRFAVGDESSPLSRIQAIIGRVLLWGGQPGVGKTALLVQMFVDALRLNPELKVLIANVEMSPQQLLERQLCRLSGVPLDIIQNRSFEAVHVERLHYGFSILENLMSRLAFVAAPFSIENVARCADAFEPQMILMDYLQRFTCGDDSSDRRNNVVVLMNTVRAFAAAGSCCFIVSALSRQKNSQGRSSYDSETLSMAAFRDSSELEFGCDDAFILTRGDDPRDITLKHLKSRNGRCEDIALEFDGAVQRFSGTFIDDVASQAESWWTE